LFLEAALLRWIFLADRSKTVNGLFGLGGPGEGLVVEDGEVDEEEEEVIGDGDAVLARRRCKCKCDVLSGALLLPRYTLGIPFISYSDLM
jgi:hypothetical protein